MEEDHVRCPNESYRITRDICRARQARRYPKCRKCKKATKVD